MKLKRIALLLSIASFAVIMGLFFSLLWAMLNLPKLNNLQDYSPSLTTRVLARDGRLIGEYYTERRYLQGVDQISDMVVSAFTSAEDDRFFTHGGVDFQGMLRAFLANMRAGHVVQGGSTITQQVAKSLLLTPERSFSRKFKEVLLAHKMESNLTKKQILYLYLNQIYLGQGAYGVESAARTYFHKTTKELSIAEAALLAGLVQAPSKYSPLKNPIRARERQEYVLGRMYKTGHISEADYKKSLQEEIRVYYEEDNNLKIAPYYTEHVRKYLIEKYGKDKLYTGGLTIETAADYDLSLAATRAVKDNLLDLDKRQGYRGPLAHFNDEDAITKELKDIRREIIEKRFPFHIMPTDVNSARQGNQEGQWVEYTLEHLKKSEDLSDERKLLIPNERYKAIVTKIDPDNKAANVLLGTIKGRLALKDMHWAKRIKPPELANWATISRVSEAISVGDEILVRILPPAATEKNTESVSVALEQEPIAQSALLSMEAATGYVVAMVGGYDYDASEYNRAMQGERQPGSSFKAFLYASAMDKGFTPSSIVIDSPLIFENQGGMNLKWIPENNSEKFYGDTTLRTAFVNSRNVPAVKLLQEVQVPYFVNYLKALGLSNPINADLSLALGSKTMSLLELTKLYALFPRLGMRIEPVFVLKITDRAGQVLEQYSYAEFQKQQAERWLKFKDQIQNEIGSSKNTALTNEPVVKRSPEEEAQLRLKRNEPLTFDDPLRAMDERSAFVMSHLLQEVVQYGTGTGAKVLKRHVGGKTGTTNEFVDAWFMGFSPELVTGVWTGFDNPRTLGHGEVGSRAALPAWIQYMSVALNTYKQDEYIIPKGIVFSQIDPKTGARARSGDASAVREAYVEGTEPSSSPAASQGTDSKDFFREDL